jgi:hypothetical protein
VVSVAVRGDHEVYVLYRVLLEVGYDGGASLGLAAVYQHVVAVRQVQPA